MLETWNFHNYIALPIEEYGRMYMGEERYVADQIVNGKFVEAMVQILLRVYPKEEIVEFREQCSPFADMTGNEISKETSEELFREFERLIKVARENF